MGEERVAITRTYEINSHTFFFFFFRPSVPYVAYVDIIPKGVKPHWRIRTTGIVQFRTYPRRAKKAILIKVLWFVNFRTKK